MKQPNNLRNRYRRMRNARRAYGFTFFAFRTWIKVAAPDSYAAKPGQPDEDTGLEKA